MVKSLNPESILDQLMTQPPIPLPQLKGESGIYALEDECGVVRYIGETVGSFLDRIYKRHVAGDDNSHKYSSIFNAGRLWHPSSRDKSAIKRSLTNSSDGNLAKRIRSRFARSKCHARIVHISSVYKTKLKLIESEILAITPAENKFWNDSRQLRSYEPRGLDEFLDSLALSDSELQALNRQGNRWKSMSAEERLVVRL